MFLRRLEKLSKISQQASHEKLSHRKLLHICICVQISFVWKNATGFVYYNTEPIVTDGWAYCFLHPTPVSNRDPLSDSATNYTVSISISNDNRTYSNELTFVVYDGLCVECSNANTCSQKVRQTVTHAYNNIYPQK